MVKRVLLILAGVVVLGVGLVLGFFYGLRPRVRPAQDLHAPTSPEAIERGRYLSEHVLGCAGCHSEIDDTRPGDFLKPGTEYGGRIFEIPADFPGTLAGANISSDPETGIGAWTDGEIVRAIREGIGKDGHTIFPIMNYKAYRRLSDEDVLAVVAYLRTRPPIRRVIPPPDINFPVSMFIRMLPEPVEHSPAAWPDDPAARGELLLEVMGCKDCHSPMERGAIVADKLYAGGMCFEGRFGKVCSPNISSHDAAGIGKWTDADLKRVFREGGGRDGRKLWVMPWSMYRGLTDTDLDALILALRKVPARSDLSPPSELKQP